MNIIQRETLTYYPFLDWLRFFSAFTVCLYHNGTFTWQFSGNFAVQVFFALSGWLIGNILLNTRVNELPRFYFNRALRIWIPYFFTLTLLILASLLHDNITEKWFEIIFYKLTFVYNLFGTQQLDIYKNLFPMQGTGNHFWSVNVEEQFYLLSPLLLVIFPDKFGKNILIWIFISVSAIISQTYGSIVLGVLFSVIVNEHRNIQLAKRSRITLLFILICSAFLMCKSNYYTLFSPICAISIVMLLSIKGRQSTLGKLVGGISYPLYMNAWVVGITVNFILKKSSINSTSIISIVNPILSVFFATVIYLLLDKKILSLRIKLYTPIRAKIITMLAYFSVFVGVCGGFAFQLKEITN